MEKIFFWKNKKIVQPEEEVTPENVEKLLSKLLPKLPVATLKVFSTLNYDTQKEIYDNLKRQKYALVKDGEILQYAFNFINGRKDFAESLMSSNLDKNYEPKVSLLVSDAQEYATRSATEMMEQFKKMK